MECHGTFLLRPFRMFIPIVDVKVGPLVDRPGWPQFSIEDSHWRSSQGVWEIGAISILSTQPSIIYKAGNYTSAVGWDFWNTSISAKTWACDQLWLFGQAWRYYVSRLSNVFLITLPRTGYSLGGTSLTEDELAPYIQQAIDQVVSRHMAIFNILYLCRSD